MRFRPDGCSRYLCTLMSCYQSDFNKRERSLSAYAHLSSVVCLSVVCNDLGPYSAS